MDIGYFDKGKFVVYLAYNMVSLFIQSEGRGRGKGCELGYCYCNPLQVSLY